MNILIPDIWLREYLKTKATPSQIKEYLSLCGPSVERIVNDVYDIEITSNRPDAMSVIGIAREAAAILPRFGIRATLIGDPYKEKTTLPRAKGSLKLTLKTDPALNPRWMSVIFENVTVKTSPVWLTKYLELAGIRSLNNVVDITNFLMRAYGQPAHVFDYDQISSHKMILRASKKGEILITLDGKKHKLPGDDIVIEDGTGKLVDLCGIMGGQNSSVTEKTKRVMLFLQTYDPSHIRKTSMSLGHRTEAASLFEKGLDPELVKPVFLKVVEMMTEHTGGYVASNVTDIYPRPYKARTVTVTLAKVRSYIGKISSKDIKQTLQALGFGASFTNGAVAVTVPSFRRDVEIDVDVIEEIARIYGYHNIPSTLPEGEPPVVLPDPHLSWEEEVKVRLRDWGFTELITYSMISEDLIRRYDQDMRHVYKIANPLSEEWVYMRPHLILSMLEPMRQNLAHDPNLKVFELANVYKYRPNELPDEVPTLIVAWAGEHYYEAKGLAESILRLFGLHPEEVFLAPSDQPTSWYTNVHLTIGPYGSVGIMHTDKLALAGITTPITRVYLDFAKLMADAKPIKQFIPIPKYPPIIEDLSFIVPDRFAVGPLMTALKFAHRLVADVTLLDVHKNARTLHITYQDPKKNLTDEEIVPVRNKLIELAVKKFGLTLKSL